MTVISSKPADKPVNAYNRLGIVIVVYKNETHIKPLLKALAKSKKPGDKIVIVDNYAPNHPCAKLIKGDKTVDQVIRLPNVGFGGGCNAGAEPIVGAVDLLLFLNPDTLPQKGAIEALRNGGQDDWGAWMGLLTLPSGKVNSAGNAVHISGLSWVLGYGEPTANYHKPKEVSVLSGADMIVRSQVWKEVGGFEADYFLYYEDTNLSFRVRLLGHKLGLVPAAHIMHDYDFGKGSHKWFYIERNRYMFMLICWPWSVLLAFAPLFIVDELGLWAISILERRFVSKLRASLSFFRVLPRSLSIRRKVQKNKKISSGEFLRLLEPTINTPLLPTLQKAPLVNGVFSAYYRLVLALLARG